ncbi:monooxygenase [Streptomyces dysideae]|uniref:Monooxygenase n=2 Tax=Streptomyces dysideae TaxID=909626 RepID=A0A101UR87_9ACTN|nr:monooxygenase [Streptomyces dysideae]
MMAGMRIRIDAVDLPGRTCPAPADGNGPVFANIHVAVQRRDRPAELLEPQPGDAVSATWTLECTATASPDGIDVTGPYVQDRLGRRFIYLSWGTVDDSGVFTMFRRAKLMIDAIPADVLAAAARDGLLVGRLGLTDAGGNPLCARVLPPHITWIAEPAGQGGPSLSHEDTIPPR